MFVFFGVDNNFNLTLFFGKLISSHINVITDKITPRISLGNGLKSGFRDAIDCCDQQHFMIGTPGKIV